MSSLNIQRLDPIDHILKRPDMYVGSIRLKKSEEYTATNQGDGTYTINKREITFPPALLRIFVEALSNAIDNVQRSKEAGVSCTKIKVSINKDTGETSILNDGFVIPIEKHDDEFYKHTLIFGELRTSTNFDDTEERTVSGRNGLGVKLLNVFSKSFKVKGIDPTNKKAFYQEWSNNMRDVKPPKITSSQLKNGFTEVSWVPDFEVFNINGYTDDIIGLYTRYVLDTAMLTKMNVYLNDEKLPIKTLLDYSKLFCSPTNEQIYIKGIDSEVVLSTSTDFEAVSFVNGVFTINGGKHVDTWSETIFRPIVDHFNKPKKPQITIKDVKQFYRVFVVSTLVNPEFTSQSKTELASPDVKAAVEKKTITSILKWDQTKKIREIIEGKEMLVMKKSESKRKTFKAIEGYEPANEAGGKHSKDCTLALCEGLSAKTFAVKGMDSELFGRSGRDWFGVYALRGKILNVIKSNPKTISENKIITDVIQTLGLRYGVDYTDDSNFSQLNYGRLLILTDADTDGRHIAGLIMTLIYHLFPTILQRTTPFLYNMSTPLAKFTIRSMNEKVFYDLRTADAFYKANDGKITTIKYYKGLGSHSDSEIEEVFGNRVIKYIKDEKADAAIVKAFGKDTHERKRWMEQYNPLNVSSNIDESDLKQDISDFIDNDFIEFPIDDCKRSIPNIMDGLKQSQRKILYACFLRNLKKPIKVAQLAGFVSEKTNYHHGEQNLYETITKMANEFVNSNNIPLLYREGQFGSRAEGGKDAANARYIFTYLEEITRYIFREEDDNLLDQVIDDGDVVEPVYYVPIIPMVLINGTSGIGSGWSSTIPNYNPLDIVKMVREWIANQDYNLTPSSDGVCIEIFDKIIPWYRGFTGTIEESSQGKYVTTGICKHTDDGVVVTEIPIGMNIQDLQESLDKLREEKKIKSHKNYSSANKPYYVIQENPDVLICDTNSLKLSSHIATTNMILFDSNGKIKKYNTVDEILVDFCKVRLKYYGLRKARMIKEIKNKLEIATGRKRFVSEIMNDTIVLKRKKEDDVVRELEAAGYIKVDGGYSYLLNLQINSFTEEKIVSLENLIVKLDAELDGIQKTPEEQMWINDLDEFEAKYNSWVLTLDEVKKKKAKVVKPTDKKSRVRRS
jgi:DNA topoisomerase-2